MSSSHNSHPHQQYRQLPSSSTRGDAPIIIGYAHDAKSGKADQAILDGINVIIWSFVHLDVDGTSVTTDQQQQQQQQQKIRGTIRTDLDLESIRTIRNKYDHVVHLAAFGGWNGPHPPPYIMSGKEWCQVFLKFNQDHGNIFDGIDWDYEGHDDISSPTSRFTLDTLDIMVDFSVEAKRHGMIVSMAPAESYLDSTIQSGSSIDAQFSFALNLPPRAWTSSPSASEEDKEIIATAGFSHAGRQCYAYVLAKAGIETFDWVSIQLYEAYSPFAHDVHRRKMDPVEALMMRINHLVVEGYTVTDVPLSSPSLSPSEFVVKIPMSKLVLGIANGWADGRKFCKVEPSSIKSSYDAALEQCGHGFLGVMFWTVEEEGNTDEQRMTYLLNRELKECETIK
ncbi:hypothetical protein ACHAXH_001789 [Discostella pseudostelligera]